MNPASIMKIMSAKKQFTVFGKGIEEGTIIELKVTKPGQEAMVTNIKVQQSDLELLQELKEMMR